jgi:transcriptional regulator with XRE-family HTH domain
MNKRYHGIGKRFAELRGERSYRQFAKDVKISDSLLQRYETSGGLPSVENLILLNKHEGVDLHWLLMGQSPMPQ